MKKLNMPKIHKHKIYRFTNKLVKRVVAFTAATAMILTSMPLNEVSTDFRNLSVLIAHAGNPPRRSTLQYNDLSQLAAYSMEYQFSSYDYSEDIIILNLNGDIKNVFPSNYIPLGTADNPFNGKIYINQTYGNSWWFETESPLFDYVTDSVEINYSDSVHIGDPIQVELRRKEGSAITPLFANHVTVSNDSNKATWKIKSAVQTQETDGGVNILVCNTSGLIGDIAQNANVSIEYENSAYDLDSGKRSNVVADGDAGLICQTMYDNSRINLTLTGSNNGCNVTSNNGSAGGLVGNMYPGSVLRLNSTYSPDSNRAVTASANGYAGGLVGYSNGGNIEFPENGSTQINGTITGVSAGGLFGYYTNPVIDSEAQNVTFYMSNYNVNCTVNATNVGGLFGELNSTANISVDGSAEGAYPITVNGASVSNFGGIAGIYRTASLANTFAVNTVTANTSASLTGTSYYGGAIGQIVGGESDSAAYICIDGLTHNSSDGFADATSFGGVVGNAGDKGSMLDVGSVTIATGNGNNEFVGGGIVGVLSTGVLRLRGTTNLTNAPSAAPANDDNKHHNRGQLVGIRQDSLVYAVGSGNDSNWTFTRSNTDVYADDIGTWGSVIRPDGTNLTLASLESQNGANTGVLDFDTTNHTVTVSAPVISNMATAADYTKTALNMQLNSGDKGALKFADSTNTKSALLSTALSFASSTDTTPLDLGNTGNIGLMRDDYLDGENEIGQYTGTISGGTVNLSIGDRYGVYSGSNPVGRGAIIAHRYNGLIARSGASTVINGLTIGGTITANSKLDNTYVGGAVANAEGGITLSSVTAQETINYRTIEGEKNIIGGMVACVSGGNTNINGGTAKPTINLTGSIGSIPVGGAIGKINNSEKNSEKAITVNTFTVAANIDASGATASGDMSCVGFISSISGGTMSLTGVTVNGTSITNPATSHAGGLLGMHWSKTDVTFTANNGAIVSGNNTLTLASGCCGAGLVQTATGHWTVPEKGISISGLTISGITNSLGIIAHDGYSGSDGLYLELTHKDSYDLASSGINIPNTSRYDELVVSTGENILSNRSKGIISITTDGDLIMNGTSCNTYQNKYNKGNLTNNKSRYYYNLTSISGKQSKSDGEKLLLWSLNKYAATNINGNFPSSLTTITGTFNLEHISYYPIDVDSAVTIGDATFQFYNDKIEASESGTGNSDSGVRTTRAASQHYLMHSGVFRNVSSTLTTTGDIHFKGNIGVGSTGSGTSAVTYSGALINGTLSGTLTTSDSKEIVFEGLTISDPTKYLFINKMSTNSKLTLSGVRTGGGKDFSNADKSGSETAYSKTNNVTDTVASSLIGDVSGNGIQISFERIKLDARTSAGSPSDLSTQYGTTKSIFSGATLLNTFAVDNNSTGTYYFAEDLDWSGSTHNANVTYGMEIKTSKEYENKEQKYSDQAHFVDPMAVPSSRTEVYPFNTGFLPYVKESTAIRKSSDPSSDDYAISKYDTRELKINVYTAGLSDGCGTYNDPYEITSGQQLIDVATSINKSSYLSSLRLPKINCNNNSDLTNLNNEIKNHWCENKAGCAEFSHPTSGSGDYTYTEGSTTYTWTEEQVSLYLASAYYVVKGNSVEIDESFPGLGASPTNDTTGKYAFRGVIVGASSDGSTTIKMSVPKAFETTGYVNTSGLITMSNGCVVKNLTIEVTPNTSDLYNYGVGGNQAYGYDEKFPNYGAVINKIMGGDNIIDNVKVKYNGKFKVVNKINNVSQDYKATIGGFVGCVVNGGLIFRNVDDTSLTDFKVIRVNSSGTQQEVKVGNTVICSSEVDGSMTDERDLIHIHVNPFVGRVINGYAIRETDSYGFSEDGKTYGDGETRTGAVGVTMHNTRKNYSIPDIDTSMNFQDDVDSVLTFTKETGETSYNTITVPNSQALYIMSIIAQSGSGCAGSNTADSENGDYANNISYCGTTGRNYSGNTAQNNKATHWANYDAIGNDTKGDDYNLSKKDTINVKTAVPYIIHKYTSAYTSGGTTYYPARALTKRTFYVNLVGGTTYYLPDSFRGIGFLGSNTLDDNMKIYGFNGNGTENSKTVIDVNTEYFVNQQDLDPYFGSNINAVYSVGIGLFNNLKQSSSTVFDSKYESDSKYQITNFTLQGYLSAHHVNKDNGSDENASPGQSRNGKFMDTAGFVPTVNYNDQTVYNFSNIMFKGLHINSYAYAAGFVAYANASNTNNAYGIMIYINNCNADGFKVEGSGRIAGFVGSYDTKRLNTGIHINTGLDSSGKDSFTSVMKNTIISNRLSTDVKQNYTAGILGSVWYANSNDNSLPSDNGDNAKGHLILRNVTIEGGNPETNYIGNKNNPSGSSGGIIGGGSSKVNGCLIQNCTVKDIDIYGKYAGGIMGEDANRNSSASKTGTRIVGCTVTGKLDENNKPQYTIMGLYYAGGVYGDTRDTNTSIHPQYKSVSAGNTDYVTYKTDIDGVYVYGYKIFSANTANENNAFDSDNGHLKTRVAAGGLIGSNNENRYIQNCKVEKCVIDVGTNADSATNTPSGGIVGQMNSGILYGYNIEVKDCDFLTHQWVAASTSNGVTTPAHEDNIQKAYTYTDENGTHEPVSGMKCGNFVGNANSKIFKLVAIHSENNPASKDFENNVSSSSFIIYADYNDVASSDAKGTEMATLSSDFDSGYSDAGSGGMGNYFPNVNVSPVIKMGAITSIENEGTEDETTVQTDVILTGDGAALYAKGTSQVPNTPVVDAIVNDADSNYKTATSTTKTFVQHALESTSYADEPNKISTYKTEMGDLPDGVEDFTVLVINTENRSFTTAFINYYIDMVTNTNHDFMSKSNRTNNYKVNVYPCTYDETHYVINAENKTAGLEINDTGTSYEYFMRNTHADSNQGDYQFSLMDVQFYNPNINIKEVVYHLYIPVLTKKMLRFEFYSASQSGTDNKASNFTDYGNTLAEGLDSWYTAYLNFRYDQIELQSILESGAGLNWNGAKTIMLKYQTNTLDSKLGSETQMVLCDPNNSDKYYYSTLESMRSLSDNEADSDTISFSKFKTKADGTGDGFAPATLNDMLLAQGFVITASQSGTASENIYNKIDTSGMTNEQKEAAKASADVIDSNGNLYVKAESSGTYKITVSYPNDNSKMLQENYYIAVRANGSKVYNYTVSSPTTTSGGENKPTLRRSNDEDGNVTTIIMGSLFAQTVSNDLNGTPSDEISATNNRLNVKLTSYIRLNGTQSDKDQMIGHLSNPNIHLYQSFIINLTANYDDSSTRSEILGEPTVTTDFRISGNGTTITETEQPPAEISDTFIQLKNHDIKEYLSSSGMAQIVADTHIVFDEEWQYNAEFPSHDGSPNQQIGVNVSAKSNLSYSEEKMRFTNMTDNPSPNSRYFYVKESDKSALVFNMKSDILDEYDKVGEPSFNYSQQGINPKNFIDETQLTLPIKATATYSATNIKRSDFANAEKISYTLKLYKKTDDNGNVEYDEVDDIADYIDLTTNDSVFIKVNSGVTAQYAAGGKMAKTGNDRLTYTADIDQTAFTTKDDQLISADIDFAVITGAGFTDYANYRFVLEVELLDSNNAPITQGSYARDWVVYTNAKINPDILSINEFAG